MHTLLLVTKVLKQPYLVDKACFYLLGCIVYIFNRGVNVSQANLLKSL